MKKAIFLTSVKTDAERVYYENVKSELERRYDIYKTVLDKSNIDAHIKAANEAEYIFSTWGMEHFSENEIKMYFPNVKCLFYAAGSVQHFAKEFLNCNIRVFSAWKANAVPVAEYTHAQIILALKGFFTAASKSRLQYKEMQTFANCCGGAYNAKVGILGVGSIGALVAEKLKQNDIEVFYYDPFLPAETAKDLGITPLSLKDIFSTCNVVSNHLANKEELNSVISGELLEMMPPYSVFINTGRGKQVDEDGLVSAMQKDETKTALLDVLSIEPVNPSLPVANCKNIIITPHIAGSMGREVVRMAEYMSSEAKRIDEKEQPLYEVTEQMLKTMA